MHATASSGLQVHYRLVDVGAVRVSCTAIEGSSVIVKSPGSCTVEASQQGDSHYLAATPVRMTFEIDNMISDYSWDMPTSAALSEAPIPVTLRRETGSSLWSLRVEGPCALRAPNGADYTSVYYNGEAPYYGGGGSFNDAAHATGDANGLKGRITLAAAGTCTVYFSVNDNGNQNSITERSRKINIRAG
ncbi:hypothetical protein FF86_10776 [Frankia sp. CpI1-P]|nr:hypothetical protein FF86_10776 [Frankia sp. CpI1-P]